MLAAAGLAEKMEDTWLPVERADAGELKSTEDLYWVCFWETSFCFSPVPGALRLVCTSGKGCPEVPRLSYFLCAYLLSFRSLRSTWSARSRLFALCWAVTAVVSKVRE
jgi:hypothetical protein